jgi:hypothetical protein
MLIGVIRKRANRYGNDIALPCHPSPVRLRSILEKGSQSLGKLFLVLFIDTRRVGQAGERDTFRDW